MAEFLRTHDHLKTLLLFSENAIFPDTKLTLSLLESHRQGRVEATSAPDYPAGLVPEIFEKAALTRLAELGLPEDVIADFMTAINKANQLFPDDP